MLWNLFKEVYCNIWIIWVQCVRFKYYTLHRGIILLCSLFYRNGFLYLKFYAMIQFGFFLLHFNLLITNLNHIAVFCKSYI